MKEFLLTISLCLLATASLFAQGRINFNNTSSTPLRILNATNNTTSVLGTASTALYGVGPASVQILLFAGLSSYSLSPVLIGTAANQPFVLNTASTIASAQGTFLGGNPLPLPGFDGSDPVFLQMIGIAINGLYYGQSPIIQVIPSLSPAAATSVFSTTADASHWDGLDITWIPEPSSGGLLGVGAVVWAAFRSRKRALQKRTTNPKQSPKTK